MSLSYTGTGRVNHGTPATWSPAGITTLAWVYPRVALSQTANHHMLSRHPSTGQAFRFTPRLYISESSGGFWRARSTWSGTTFGAADSNIGTINNQEWQCIAATFDTGASPNGQIFIGSKTVALANATSATQDVVAPHTGDGEVYTGNVINGGEPLIDSPLAFVAVYNRVLSLAEMDAILYQGVVLDGCLFMNHPGYNGTGTQIDLSGNGNHGTITGSTVSLADHGPFGPPFAYEAINTYEAAAAPAAGANFLTLLGVG